MTKKLTNQEKVQKNPRVWDSLEKNISFQRENLDQWHTLLSSGYNKGFRRYLDYLIGISNTNAQVYPTHETIARNIDLSRDQVKNHHRKAKEYGFLVSVQRRVPKGQRSKKMGGNKFGYTSNLYMINPLFREMDVRDMFRGLIPALKFLPLVLIMLATEFPTQSQSSSKNVFSKFMYLKHIPITYTYTYRKYAIRREISNYTKKDFYMSNEPSDFDIFSDIVRAAGSELYLTPAGMCSLSAYSDMVIGICLQMLRNNRSEITSPFGWFLKLCENKSRELEFKVNKRRPYEIAEQLNIALGSEPSCYEKGLEPRKPSKKSRKREYASSSTKTYTPRAAQGEVSSSFAGSYSIDELRAANPTLEIQQVFYVAPSKVKIVHHYDTDWRATTEEEQRIWQENIGNMSVEGKKNLLKAGLTPPSPPLYFHGDSNSPARQIYHIGKGGILHLKGQNQAPCKECDISKANTPEPEEPVVREQPRCDSVEREYTAQEQEGIIWFRALYKHMKDNKLEIPLWFEDLIRVIKAKPLTLEGTLQRFKQVLELNGWRYKDGHVVRETAL